MGRMFVSMKVLGDFCVMLFWIRNEESRSKSALTCCNFVGGACACIMRFGYLK